MVTSAILATPLATHVIFAFFMQIVDFIHLCLDSLMSTSGKQMPSNIVELTRIIEPLTRIKEPIATPVSTATCERSIATVKLVKTYLKSTIDYVWLSVLKIPCLRNVTFKMSQKLNSP